MKKKMDKSKKYLLELESTFVADFTKLNCLHNLKEEVSVLWEKICRIDFKTYILNQMIRNLHYLTPFGVFAMEFEKYGKICETKSTYGLEKYFKEHVLTDKDSLNICIVNSRCTEKAFQVRKKKLLSEVLVFREKRKLLIEELLKFEHSDANTVLETPIKKFNKQTRKANKLYFCQYCEKSFLYSSAYYKHYIKKSYVEYRKEVSQFLEEVETEIENNEQSEIQGNESQEIEIISQEEISIVEKVEGSSQIFVSSEIEENTNNQCAEFEILEFSISFFFIQKTLKIPNYKSVRRIKEVLGEMISKPVEEIELSGWSSNLEPINETVLNTLNLPPISYLQCNLKKKKFCHLTIHDKTHVKSHFMVVDEMRKITQFKIDVAFITGISVEQQIWNGIPDQLSDCETIGDYGFGESHTLTLESFLQNECLLESPESQFSSSTNLLTVDQVLLELSKMDNESPSHLKDNQLVDEDVDPENFESSKSQFSSSTNLLSVDEVLVELSKMDNESPSHLKDNQLADEDPANETNDMETLGSSQSRDNCLEIENDFHQDTQLLQIQACLKQKAIRQLANHSSKKTVTTPTSPPNMGCACGIEECIGMPSSLLSQAFSLGLKFGRNPCILSQISSNVQSKIKHYFVKEEQHFFCHCLLNASVRKSKRGTVYVNCIRKSVKDGRCNLFFTVGCHPSHLEM